MTKRWFKGHSQRGKSGNPGCRCTLARISSDRQRARRDDGQGRGADSRWVDHQERSLVAPHSATMTIGRERRPNPANGRSFRMIWIVRDEPVLRMMDSRNRISAPLRLRARKARNLKCSRGDAEARRRRGESIHGRGRIQGPRPIGCLSNARGLQWVPIVLWAK